MFIFTPGFAFWYACTDGSRVESVQTVISAEAFWATGANDAVADDCVVGVALAHPARRAATAARPRAAAVRLVRWCAPTGVAGDLIVLPFCTCMRVGLRCRWEGVGSSEERSGRGFFDEALEFAAVAEVERQGDSRPGGGV